jgi:signal peptidase I
MDLNVNYVKRCVALPGDTFSIENGIYKVKGVPDETLGHIENQRKMSAKALNEHSRERVFPSDTAHFRWTLKDFGSLYIPQKDDCLKIDTFNYLLYRNLITYETSLPVEVRDSEVWLGDSIIRQYTFRMNYYFMAGDYVSNSVDSRYWGLVPEDHIIGKAVLVWSSKDKTTGKYRWRRFLKLL